MAFFNNYFRFNRFQKLLIIGSGCSKNFSQGTSSIAGLESPLDTDFFKMAKKVILHQRLERSLAIQIEGLIHNLHRLYGYPMFEIKDWINSPEANNFLKILDDDRLSLEKVMTQLTLLNEVIQTTPQFDGYYQGENRPINLDNSAKALVELVALTISKALEGPICSEHIQLANSLSHGDVVISFNYDLLMDNALRDTNKLTDSGYLIPFQKVLAYNEQTRLIEGDSPVTMIKLHGSLNWLNCTYCNVNILNRYEKFQFEYETIPNKCPYCGESSAYLQRVIVPPLLAKNYSIQPLRFLWSQAEKYIARAREIVIIGYSFPPTDFGTEALLRASFPWEYQKDIRFVIVNPDKEVFERFQKTFNSSTVEWRTSLKEYLESV